MQLITAKFGKTTSIITAAMLLTTFAAGNCFAQTQAESQTQLETQNTVQEGGFVIKPAYPNNVDPYVIIQELKPETETQTAIRIQNLSSNNQEYLLYAVDRLADANGAPNYAQMNDPKNELGAWTTLETNKIILKPSEEKLINVTIKVPENTLQGTYKGGIALENQKPDLEHPGLLIATRIIQAIEIKVTNTPETVKEYGRKEISLANWLYLGGTVIVFAACAGYYLHEQKKQKTPKHHEKK